MAPVCRPAALGSRSFQIRWLGGMPKFEAERNVEDGWALYRYGQLVSGRLYRNFALPLTSAAHVLLRWPPSRVSWCPYKARLAAPRDAGSFPVAGSRVVVHLPAVRSPARTDWCSWVFLVLPLKFIAGSPGFLILKNVCILSRRNGLSALAIQSSNSWRLYPACCPVLLHVHAVVLILRRP